MLLGSRFCYAINKVSLGNRLSRCFPAAAGQSTGDRAATSATASVQHGLANNTPPRGLTRGRYAGLPFDLKN